MADVRWIASDSDLPKDRQFVLVKFGKENGLHRHSAGLTYSVDRGLNANLLEAHLQTVISEAQTLADFERIDTVYVSVPKTVTRQSERDAS
jgi:hypothetical protein